MPNAELILFTNIPPSPPLGSARRQPDGSAFYRAR
jgi:hypothetical protein